jgi:hypothetical protein
MKDNRKEKEMKRIFLADGGANKDSNDSSEFVLLIRTYEDNRAVAYKQAKRIAAKHGTKIINCYDGEEMLIAAARAMARAMGHAGLPTILNMQ